MKKKYITSLLMCIFTLSLSACLSGRNGVESGDPVDGSSIATSSNTSSSITNNPNSHRETSVFNVPSPEEYDQRVWYVDTLYKHDVIESMLGDEYEYEFNYKSNHDDMKDQSLSSYYYSHLQYARKGNIIHSEWEYQGSDNQNESYNNFYYMNNDTPYIIINSMSSQTLYSGLYGIGCAPYYADGLLDFQESITYTSKESGILFGRSVTAYITDHEYDDKYTYTKEHTIVYLDDETDMTLRVDHEYEAFNKEENYATYDYETREILSLSIGESSQTATFDRIEGLLEGKTFGLRDTFGYFGINVGDFVDENCIIHAEILKNENDYSFEAELKSYHLYTDIEGESKYFLNSFAASHNVYSDEDCTFYKSSIVYSDVYVEQGVEHSAAFHGYIKKDERLYKLSMDFIGRDYEESSIHISIRLF